MLGIIMQLKISARLIPQVTTISYHHMKKILLNKKKIVTKLKNILKIKKKLVYKLIYIIVKWFLNWYVINYQGFCY